MPDLIKDAIPKEVSEKLEQASNKIKDFNEQMEKVQPEGYTNILTVLKNFETQLEKFKKDIGNE